MEQHPNEIFKARVSGIFSQKPANAIKNYRWLVTGAAGFIGSHITEALLSAGQDVTGVDNFSSGSERNLAAAQASASREAKFRFINGDIRDAALCERICEGADAVLHHAAFISVPASVTDPAAVHAHNVDGFFNMLTAAKNNRVRRFVYASSSAVYGCSDKLPLKEEDAGAPLLSPYAATKRINELYAQAWGSIYGLECIGLRYFNVFGPRQDPGSPYSAVIPRWTRALASGLPVSVYGDGENSRDFCYVKNVVLANLLAAATENPEASGKVCNIACGEKTTLNALYETLKRMTAPDAPAPLREKPRAGDIAHSVASIERARLLLGYEPLYSLEAGLAEMLGNG